MCNQGYLDGVGGNSHDEEDGMKTLQMNHKILAVVAFLLLSIGMALVANGQGSANPPVQQFEKAAGDATGTLLFSGWQFATVEADGDVEVIFFGESTTPGDYIGSNDRVDVKAGQPLPVQLRNCNGAYIIGTPYVRVITMR